MLGFIKNLLAGKAADKEAEPAPATEYQGFTIVPAPKEGTGGWSTEALISKSIEGETKTHHFIRADKTGSRDGAVELTLNKCRQTIDQLNDGIFR